MNNKDYLKKILSANIHVEDEKLEESLNELGTPITDKPHQQLVTGADGVPMWEERNGYTKLADVKPIIENEALFFNDGRSGCYFYDNSVLMSEFGAWNYLGLYKMIWDGTEYICPMIKDPDSTYGKFFGNIHLRTVMGWSIPSGMEDVDTGEPFYVYVSDESVCIYTTDTDSTHTVSLIEIGEVTVPIPAKYLPNVIFDLENRTCNVDFDTFVSVLQGGGMFTIIKRYYDDPDDPRYDAERAIPIYFAKSDEMPGYAVYYLNQSGNVGHFVYTEMGYVMVAE